MKTTIPSSTLNPSWSSQLRRHGGNARERVIFDNMPGRTLLEPDRVTKPSDRCDGVKHHADDRNDGDLTSHSSRPKMTRPEDDCRYARQRSRRVSTDKTTNRDNEQSSRTQSTSKDDHPLLLFTFAEKPAVGGTHRKVPSAMFSDA
jgi:hypothetical protein